MEIRVNDIQDPDFRSRVEQVVSSRIRPMLRRCGGDLRLREKGLFRGNSSSPGSDSLLCPVSHTLFTEGFWS